MKKILLFSLLFFIGINYVYASTDTAYSYVLMDEVTGRVLKGKNIDSPKLIASITKIMTCLLAIESNKLDDIINMLSQALEEDTCAAWDDELFEDLYNPKITPEELYKRVIDYLIYNQVSTRRTPFTLEDCIDNIFSHNSVVSINEERQDNKDEPAYLYQIFRGMAHEIPKKLLSRKFISIHSVVSDNAYDDRIFIEVGKEEV